MIEGDSTKKQPRNDCYIAHDFNKESQVWKIMEANLIF